MQHGRTPLVQDMLAVIATHLGMGRGRWKVELRFEDGRVREWWRHEERMPPARLEETVVETVVEPGRRGPLVAQTIGDDPT